MTIEAELPDGTILEFPDGTDQSVIQNVVKQQLGLPHQPAAAPTASVPVESGLIEPGNINLNNRPQVRNPDGTISTVRSMSVNFDGKEFLIPTVSDDGRVLSDKDAIDLFRRTGRHLGVFDTPQNATAFAEKLHEQQAQQITRGGAGQPSARAQMPPAQERPAGIGATLGRFALDSFVTGILGVPEAIANMAPSPGQVLEPLTRFASPPPAPERQRSLLEDVTGSRELPVPDVQDVRAGIEVLGGGGGEGSIPQRFSQARQGVVSEEARLAEERPIASTVGQFLGEGALLATGRLPGAKALARRPGEFVKKSTALPSGTQRFITRQLESPKVKKLARGAGRSLEAGLEATALSMLQDQDPVETASWAAGGQVAGSLFLEGGKGLVSGGVLKAGAKIGIAAAAAASLIQLTKSAIPGDRERILESIETGFDKVKLALLLGTMSGTVGLGRLRGGKTAEDFPKITDFINTLPRGAFISAIQEAVTDDRVEPVMGALAEDPEFFGKKASTQILRSMEGKTEKGLSATLNTLMKDRAFRRRLEELTVPASGQAAFAGPAA